MVFVLSPRLRLILLCWMIAETLVFVGVAQTIGIGGALLVGLLTSLSGASLLKRMGRAAMERLRGAVSNRAEVPRGMIDGTLQVVAAIALLLPGFLSDALGLALCVPAVRAAAARRLRGRGWRPRFGETGGPHGPDAIDLAPDQWSSAGPPSPR